RMSSPRLQGRPRAAQRLAAHPVPSASKSLPANAGPAVCRPAGALSIPSLRRVMLCGLRQRVGASRNLATPRPLRRPRATGASSYACLHHDLELKRGRPVQGEWRVGRSPQNARRPRSGKTAKSALTAPEEAPPPPPAGPGARDPAVRVGGEQFDLALACELRADGDSRLLRRIVTELPAARLPHDPVVVLAWHNMDRHAAASRRATAARLGVAAALVVAWQDRCRRAQRELRVATARDLDLLLNLRQQRNVRPIAQNGHDAVAAHTDENVRLVIDGLVLTLFHSLYLPPAYSLAVLPVVHDTEVMLRVLVPVLHLDPVARQGGLAGQRDITLVVLTSVAEGGVRRLL